MTKLLEDDVHLRIEEAERGIVEGKVVSHEEVLRHSYELLEKSQVFLD